MTKSELLALLNIPVNPEHFQKLERLQQLREAHACNRDAIKTLIDCYLDVSRELEKAKSDYADAVPDPSKTDPVLELLKDLDKKLNLIALAIEKMIENAEKTETEDESTVQS